MQPNEVFLNKVTIRIPGRTYGFVDAELNIWDDKDPKKSKYTLADIMELMKQDRMNELKDRQDCGHFFTYIVSGETKAGRVWKKEVCHACNAIRWHNDDGSVGQWQWSIKE